MRRLGTDTDGTGFEGPVDSAAIAACLRFVPVISGATGGVIDGKANSVGGLMIATEGSPVLGSRVAEKGAAAGDTMESFGLAFDTANSRDLEERKRD